MENAQKVKLGDLLLELERATLSIDLLNRLILLKEAMIKANIPDEHIKIVERKLREIFINKFNDSLPNLSEETSLKMICFAQCLEKDERVLDFYYCDDEAIAYYKCGKTPDNYTLLSPLNSNDRISYVDLRYAAVDEYYKSSEFRSWAHEITPEINKAIKKLTKTRHDTISVIGDEEVPWFTNDKFLIDADYSVLVDFNDLSKIKIIIVKNKKAYGFTVEKKQDENKWKYTDNVFEVSSLKANLTPSDPKITKSTNVNLLQKINKESNN